MKHISKSVTYVPEHPLPLSQVHTEKEGEGGGR
jgi:hypothetical protein